MVNRKRRNDRNHIIYKLVCLATNDTYIGMTQMHGRAVNKSVHIRWLQHLSRARTQDKTWTLYKLLRQYDSSMWLVQPIETIRGKLAAHMRECAIIAQIKPSLNTRAAA